MMGRVLKLVRELVRGRVLDRHMVSSLLAMTPAAADRFARDVVKHWPDVGKKRDGRRVLHWSKTGTVSNSVAVAACLGSSLSRLFDGSAYEAASREARSRVLDHVRRPELFEHFDRKFYFVRGGGEMMLPDNAAFFDDIVDAVLQHNPLRMKYRHFEGREDQVFIKPLSIAVYRQQLYVIGRGEDGVDHPYRFSRIAHVERDGSSFEYPGKAQYEPERLFDDSFGIFIGPGHDVEDVELKLHPRWKPFVSCHRWHRSQRVLTGPDHLIVRLRVRLCPELVSWILGFGPEMEVIAPPSLREQVRGLIEATRRVYTRDTSAPS